MNSRGGARRFTKFVLDALLALLVGVWLGSGAGGCSGGGREKTGERTGSREVPALEDLNVLLIVIDTLGAEHVGCLSPGLRHTPSIDALAAEGVLFRRAYSPAPWTQPAVASLLTGLLPSRHGVHRLLDVLPPERETLAELLAARGFHTAGVISHFLIGASYGYDQGFAEYDASPVGGPRAITSAKVTAQAIAALDRLRDQRFFLFVHYFDPHGLYNHHPEFDLTRGYRGRLHPAMEIETLREMRHQLAPEDVAYLVGLHREEIAYTDHHVGRLLAHLDELGLAGGTLVVLAADHGEEFMRHGWIGHTVTLYDELLHVPLIVRLPGVLVPREVAAPVSLLDVVPTLLATSRTPAAELSSDGEPLWGLLTGGEDGDPDRELVAEVSFVAPSSWPGADTRRSAFKTAWMTGSWKLIHDLESGRWLLFDRAADPEELRDLSRRTPPALAPMRERLSAWEEHRAAGWRPAADDMRDTDPETVRRLRSLGYVR
jgi:choline-sulfatase